MIHTTSRCWWAGLVFGLLLAALCINHGARSARTAAPPSPVPTAFAP
jgi:hypothetical protein